MVGSGCCVYVNQLPAVRLSPPIYHHHTGSAGRSETTNCDILMFPQANHWSGRSVLGWCGWPEGSCGVLRVATSCSG